MFDMLLFHFHKSKTFDTLSNPLLYTQEFTCQKLEPYLFNNQSYLKNALGISKKNTLYKEQKSLEDYWLIDAEVQ